MSDNIHQANFQVVWDDLMECVNVDNVSDEEFLNQFGIKSSDFDFEMPMSPENATCPKQISILDTDVELTILWSSFEYYKS